MLDREFDSDSAAEGLMYAIDNAIGSNVVVYAERGLFLDLGLRYLCARLDPESKLDLMNDVGEPEIIDMMKILLQAGANPNSNIDRNTFYRWAHKVVIDDRFDYLYAMDDSNLATVVSTGNMEMVMLLLQYHADVRGFGETTPLGKAVGYEHYDIANILLDRGAILTETSVVHDMKDPQLKAIIRSIINGSSARF